MDKVKKIFTLLTKSEKKTTIYLFFMVLVMAFMDVLGVASIMPFIAVISNPEIIETNDFFSWLFNFSKVYFDVQNINDFLFFFGVLVFSLLVTSLAFKAFTRYFEINFSLMREYSFSRKLVRSYLLQPYKWFLNRNSSDLGTNILAEVGSVINGILVPILNIFVQGSIVISILLLLMIIDFKIAISAGLILIISYLLIYKFMSHILLKLGNERFEANKKRFITVSESFNAIKEVKVSTLESFYIEKFSIYSKIYAKHQAFANVIGQLPKYVIESVAFGGLMVLVLISIQKNSNILEILPIVALYAFAGYRLMPALQSIYASITLFRVSGPVLDKLYEDFMNTNTDDINENFSKNNLDFKRNISLKNISFVYPSSSKVILEDISLKIPCKNTIGFVGATGSGKTTAVDLILGLLEPRSGSIFIDDVILNKSNYKQWLPKIGYVPQQIYLADDTIAANIAFGLEKNEINLDQVINSSKISNLHNFVKNDLDMGYDTIVGERGVRLSGGQRQRIGIARALYRNPDLLVLDEATSALDNLTELAFMDALNNLEHKITIIMIAHRLNTIKSCDTIFFFEKGKIIGSGNYNDLISTNEKFRTMANETKSPKFF